MYVTIPTVIRTFHHLRKKLLICHLLTSHPQPKTTSVKYQNFDGTPERIERDLNTKYVLQIPTQMIVEESVVTLPVRGSVVLHYCFSSPFNPAYSPAMLFFFFFPKDFIYFLVRERAQAEGDAGSLLSKDPVSGLDPSTLGS